MAKSQKDRETMLNSFADPEKSDSIELSMVRQEPDNRTFTPEALDDFKDNVFLFIGGRICAFHDKTGLPAKKLKVRIEVTVEN